MSRNKRSQARRYALQALYQWQMTGQDVMDIEAQFASLHDLSGIDQEYFHELLHGVPRHLHALDDHIAPVLDRPLREVDPVETAILRLGSYELQHRIDIPYRVVINEAVELAKTFGGEHGHKYVNSILDKVARKLRATEVQARAKEAGKRPPTGGRS